MHLSNRWCLSSLFHSCDLATTSALHCSDPITLNRLQTGTKNMALWANASLSSDAHHSALITGRGLEENCFAVMTILWVATQQFLFFGPTSLIYPTWCCASFKVGSVCVLGVLGKIKDLLGLGACSRLMAVRNLLWHHQIHDQPLILQKLNGVPGGLGRALLLCNHF